MLIRNNAMRANTHRRYLRHLRHLNKPIGITTTTTKTTSTTTTSDTTAKCKETVIEKHSKTGLPLLTRVVYKNGKIMYIHYKSNGSGIVDHLVFL